MPRTTTNTWVFDTLDPAIRDHRQCIRLCPAETRKHRRHGRVRVRDGEGQRVARPPTAGIGPKNEVIAGGGHCG